MGEKYGNKTQFISMRVIHYLILSSIALTVVIPFLWMLSTSFKGSGVMYEIPPRWIPQKFIWANYLDTLIKNHFLRFGVNSIYVSLMASIGQLFTCSLAGFAFARLKFPGRDLLFGVLLITMMIPLQVMIIPEFLIMLGLGWIDSPLFLPLIVPSWLAGAFGTFMLRQFFLTLPRDLEDAAKIDGCSYLGIFRHIILPLFKPALATLTTFTFMGTWMSFMLPLIVMNTHEKFTLPIGLAYFKSLHGTDWTLLMAGSVMMILPILNVFIFNQRYFVEGIKLTGIKG